MPRILTTIVTFGLLALASLTSAPRAFAQHWKLSWSDEFNGPDGAPPDPAKWEIVTGGNGFGNKELEQYTTRPENIRQEHGNLVITARRESFTGADGILRGFMENSHADHASYLANHIIRQTISRCWLWSYWHRHRRCVVAALRR